MAMVDAIVESNIAKTNPEIKIVEPEDYLEVTPQ